MRASAVTNRNFADFAAFHRTQLGKPAALTPWGRVVTYLPTPEQSAYRFSYHEQGAPDKERTHFLNKLFSNGFIYIYKVFFLVIIASS